MQSVYQEGIYKKTVAAALASLSRSQPDRAAEIGQAHRALLNAEMDSSFPTRLLSALPPGTGAHTVQVQAIRDVAKALGMRSITSRLALYSLESSSLDSRNDIVFLSSPQDGDDYLQGANAGDLDDLYKVDLAKARQAALFFKDMECMVLPSAEHQPDSIRSVLSGPVSRMADMAPNEVYSARLVTVLQGPALQRIVSSALEDMEVKDLEFEPFRYKPAPFDSIPLPFKHIDYDPGFTTPRSWRQVSDQIESLTQKNGQAPSADELETLAAPLVGPDKAREMADALRLQQSGDASGTLEGLSRDFPGFLSKQEIKKIADMIQAQPPTGSFDGISTTIDEHTLATPNNWFCFFHELAHMAYHSGANKRPDVQKVEALATALLGSETALKLGEALRNDQANATHGSPLFFEALEDRRRQGETTPNPTPKV